MRDENVATTAPNDREHANKSQKPPLPFYPSVEVGEDRVELIAEGREVALEFRFLARDIVGDRRQSCPLVPDRDRQESDENPRSTTTAKLVQKLDARRPMRLSAARRR